MRRKKPEPYDTLKVVQHLVAAGIERKHAEAYTETMNEMMNSELVKTSDLKKVHDELNYKVEHFHDDLDAKITGVRVELKQEISTLKHEVCTLRSDVKHEMTELRLEVKHDIAGIKRDMKDLRTSVVLQLGTLMVALFSVAGIIFSCVK